MKLQNERECIAMQCLACNVTTVHRKYAADGHRCTACGGGPMRFIGDAIIGTTCKRESAGMTIRISVDGLDEVLEKMKRIELATAMAVDNIRTAQKLLGLNVNKT